MYLSIHERLRKVATVLGEAPGHRRWTSPDDFAGAGRLDPYLVPLVRWTSERRIRKP